MTIKPLSLTPSMPPSTRHGAVDIAYKACDPVIVERLNSLNGITNQLAEQVLLLPLSFPEICWRSRATAK